MLKKILALTLAAVMMLSLTACRKVLKENSYISDTTSNIKYGVVEIVEPETSSGENQSADADITETQPQQNTSSKQENTSSQTETKPIKSYGGSLPSVSIDKIPSFAPRQFEISGFWAPYEISEESFKQYKDAGFTTLAMINHSLGNTSEEQFYLGSERTMKALQLCKKVGLNAILNYNDWKAEQCEGADYNGNKPFSKYDLYGEYKDIITGIHICDEPYLRHIDEYGNKTMVEDFKKVYPNAKFIVNLIPYTAYTSRGFDTYEQMMEIYEKAFMEPFNNPFVSVDVYPFHNGSEQDDGTLALNYEYIAKSAKKYGVKPGFILQSSVGGDDEGKKEFEMELSEGDLRWEINSALCFGADTLQYYCYSVPKSFDENGNDVFMYDKCILNRDNTPSDIYYSLQKLHKEIQSFANVILAYDWDESIGVLGQGSYFGRVSNLAYDKNFDTRYFKDPKHCVGIVAAEELIVSRFTNEQYGEAYMFVNFADRIENTVTASFRDCKAIAVYSGKTSDTPKIINLDQNGQVTLNFDYGDGFFVVPLV